MSSHVLLSAGASLGLLSLPLHADTFGNGTNQFTIEFVSIGNAGNGDDFGGGGGLYGSEAGGVGYNYRIATYEIAEVMIVKAAALGLENVWAGAWSGNQPAANMDWYEAAAFVNWLNEEKGYHAAYNLTRNPGWSMSLWDPPAQASTGVDSGTNPYRHKDAFYFLPSEDEWCKAAYHRNDGVTANYWDYPTQDNYSDVPDGIDFAGDPDYEAVFNDGYYQTAPYEVTDAGSSASAYGTFGQGGNVWEWMETAFDGVNDSPSENRMKRGGGYYDSHIFLRSVNASGANATTQNAILGFRVASLEVIPEPTTLSLLGVGSLALAMRRRRERFLER